MAVYSNVGGSGMKNLLASLNNFSARGGDLNIRAKQKTAFWFTTITAIIRRR